MITHIDQNLLAGALNKKIDIYLVQLDAYHNEEKVQVAQEVPARVIKESETVRKYRRDKNIAETTYEFWEVRIPSDPKGEYILKSLRKRDIVVFDNKEFRIVDINFHHNINGKLEYITLIVA